MPEIVTEIFHSGAWHGISADVYNRQTVSITRGRPDETGTVKAGRMRPALDNRTGRYSPRNPRSDLFGLIGRNTPLRITVDGSIRFVGEVASWPQDWSPKGADVFTQTQVAGILRRLGQGASPLQSAPRRYIPFTDPVAYWPLSDDEDSTVAAPAVGSASMKPRVVQPDWAAASPATWLESFPEFQNPTINGRLEGKATMPGFSLSAGWTLAALFIPRGTDGATTVVLQGKGALGFVLSVGIWASSFDKLTIFRNLEDLSTGSISTADIGVFSAPGLHDGGPHWVELHAWQDGPFTRVQARMDGVELAVDSGGSEILPIPLQAPGIVYTGGLIGDSIGHIAVWDNRTAMSDVSDAAFGWQGETAGRRIERLCEEEGVAFTSVGGLDESAAMGPQGIATFLDLIRECELADQGILYESRASIELAYRTRVDLYNQEPVLALIYGDGVFRSAPTPIDDDQRTRNDVTVTRRDGSSARAQKLNGPLSVQPPPAGVGRYDEGLTVNLAGDGQLPNDASWRLSLGTVDEARYPSLHLQLIAPAYAAGSTLTADAVALDIGDRIVINDPPDWLPPDQISVLVQGFTETLSLTGRDIVINTAPESPYQVAEYEAAQAGTHRYDTAGSSLAIDFDAGTDTSMIVEVNVLPLWTTDVNEFPFDIECGGVRLTVTDISGTTSTQAFVIVQTPVNGVVKTIPAGTPVSLWTKARYAL